MMTSAPRSNQIFMCFLHVQTFKTISQLNDHRKTCHGLSVKIPRELKKYFEKLLERDNTLKTR